MNLFIHNVLQLSFHFPALGVLTFLLFLITPSPSCHFTHTDAQTQIKKRWVSKWQCIWVVRPRHWEQNTTRVICVPGFILFAFQSLFICAPSPGVLLLLAGPFLALLEVQWHDKRLQTEWVEKGSYNTSKTVQSGVWSFFYLQKANTKGKQKVYKIPKTWHLWSKKVVPQMHYKSVQSNIVNVLCCNEQFYIAQNNFKEPNFQ